MTPEQIEALAREAGFRIFGNRIVAADGTQSVPRLIAAVRDMALEEAAATCDWRVTYRPHFKDADEESKHCAAAIRALKASAR